MNDFILNTRFSPAYKYFFLKQRWFWTSVIKDLTISDSSLCCHRHDPAHVQDPGTCQSRPLINKHKSNAVTLFIGVECLTITDCRPALVTLQTFCLEVTPSDLWPDDVGAVLPLGRPGRRLPKSHRHGDERQLHFLWKGPTGPDQRRKGPAHREQGPTGNPASKYDASGLNRVVALHKTEVCFCFFKSKTPPAGNKTQYEEIDIPVALLSYSDMLDISKVRGLPLIK